MAPKNPIADQIMSSAAGLANYVEYVNRMSKLAMRAARVLETDGLTKTETLEACFATTCFASMSDSKHLDHAAKKAAMVTAISNLYDVLSTSVDALKSQQEKKS